MLLSKIKSFSFAPSKVTALLQTNHLLTAASGPNLKYMKISKNIQAKAYEALHFHKNIILKGHF